MRKLLQTRWVGKVFCCFKAMLVTSELFKKRCYLLLLFVVCATSQPGTQGCYSSWREERKFMSRFCGGEIFSNFDPKLRVMGQNKSFCKWNNLVIVQVLQGGSPDHSLLPRMFLELVKHGQWVLKLSVFFDFFCAVSWVFFTHLLTIYIHLRYCIISIY